jgi:O-antigen/teichoic acid export membrane protein
MLDKKIVTSSLFFVFAKYINLFIGFFRTTFVALILTKNQMGELVLIYLVTEYISYLLLLGIPNAINLQISIDRNLFKNFNHKSLRVQKYYSIFFFIILVVSLFIYCSLYLASNFYEEFFKKIIIDNYNKIFTIVLLFGLNNFFTNHNRLWEKNYNLIFSDLTFQLVYFFGLFFLLEHHLDDPIDFILKVIIFSQFCALIVANIKISLGHLIKFSKENLVVLLPMGCLLMLQNMMELYFWGIDRLFVSFYLSSESLASFHIAHTYARGLMVFFSATTFLIYPRLLTTLSSEKTPNIEIKRIIDKAFSISETILIFIFVLTIAIVPFLMNLILEKYDNFFYIFTIIVFGLIVKSLTFFSASFIVSRKKQQELIINSFVFLIALIFLYYFMNYLKIIKTPEEFALTATIIFLLFSMRLYQWSMKDLEQKNIFNLIVKKFWKLHLIYFIILLCYINDIGQVNAFIYILLSSFLIYIKVFLYNFKIIYLSLLDLFFKKLNKVKLSYK